MWKLLCFLLLAHASISKAGRLHLSSDLSTAEQDSDAGEHDDPNGNVYPAALANSEDLPNGRRAHQKTIELMPVQVGHDDPSAFIAYDAGLGASGNSRVQHAEGSATITDNVADAVDADPSDPDANQCCCRTREVAVKVLKKVRHADNGRVQVPQPRFSTVYNTSGMAWSLSTHFEAFHGFIPTQNMWHGKCPDPGVSFLIALCQTLQTPYGGKSVIATRCSIREANCKWKDSCGWASSRFGVPDKKICNGEEGILHDINAQWSSLQENTVQGFLPSACPGTG
jgi:hypothetical protein